MQRYVELKIVVKFTPRARRDSMHDYYYVSLRKTDLVKLKQSDIGLSDSLITCTEGFNLFHLGLTKKLR